MTETPPERPDTPVIGPLTLEAALLLDVVADRLTSMKRSTTAGGSPGPNAAADDDPGSQSQSEMPGAAGGRCPECGSVPGASCTACPLCRFMALLRGERPEATAKLVDGALMIIRTLRSLVPDPPDPAPHPQSDQPTPPPARRGGLEHIDIL